MAVKKPKRKQRFNFNKLKKSAWIITIAGAVISITFTILYEYYKGRSNCKGSEMQYREELFSWNTRSKDAAEKGMIGELRELINEGIKLYDKYSPCGSDSLIGFNLKALAHNYYDFNEIDTSRKVEFWLTMAERYYIQAADVARKHNLNPLYFGCKVNLANTYNVLSDFSKKKERLIKSIQSIRNALEYQSEVEKKNVYSTYYNLQSSYSLLTEITCNTDYLDSAMDCLNICIAMNDSNMFQDKKALSLALGNLYLYYCDYKHSQDTIILAIKNYELAVQFYSIEYDAAKHYKVKRNLAEAYLFLSPYLKTDTAVLEAQELLTEIETVFNNDKKTKIDAYKLYYNFGRSYYELASFHKPDENLKKGIDFFDKALNVMDYEEDPVRMALVQEEKGNIYSKWYFYNHDSQNYNKAVSFYKAALAVNTPEDYPCDHKRISKSLEIISDSLKIFIEKKN